MGRLRTRRRLVGLIALIIGVVVVATAVGLARTSTSAPAPEAMTIVGGPTSRTDAAPVTLDAELYRPTALGPDGTAPAVIVAHGFGGSKDSVAQEAAALAEAGFVVLAYSARGFGESAGSISMNSPDFEVADASAAIDTLAALPGVRLDGVGDPVVGIAGGSYGGALALLTAGYDPRVDAVAADITWNSLESSLFGQSALGSDTRGVYKELWSGLFFSSGLTLRDGTVTECGRFTPDWCRAYTEAAVDGTVSPEGSALMWRSSPGSVTDRIAAPTLLGGGQADSLFPLNETNANAEQIMEANPDVPVEVVWHAGGHDGGLADPVAVTEQLREMTIGWFQTYLGSGASQEQTPLPGFEYALTEGSALSDRAAGTFETFSAPTYPGLRGDERSEVAIAGPPQQILAPAGGIPAAFSSVPGLGGVGALLGQFGGVMGGAQQTATFLSEPLTSTITTVGSPTARLRIAVDRPVDEVALFAAVRIIDDQGRSQLPASLVSPVRLTDFGTEPVVVDIELPTIVANAPAGTRLAVTVTTTDQAYRLPSGPAIYTVSLVEGAGSLAGDAGASPVLVVPTVASTPISSSWPVWIWPVLAIAVLVLLALVLVLTRPRPGQAPRDGGPPVIVTGLAKEYPGGVRAVDSVDFTVPRGVVLGLLGPNGAGKSTTMRMMMGLITPTAGSVEVFGEQIRPGAAALSRVGCFIEGPGLLPHLSGRQNLDLFWRASGRSGDPHLAEVLTIAGLGSAIDRRVRTYSQGMRQRLGIAQAMLGMPDLLLLDEPTNGLDPPQIKEMREVLRAYAQDGRTVIVSSHLLSEVEQTCSIVVVMGGGRVIAQGEVEVLLREHHGRRLEDVFLDLVGEGHQVTT